MSKIFLMTAVFLQHSILAKKLSNEEFKETFIDSKIIPDVIKNPPKKNLNVNYPNVKISNPGKVLTYAQVKVKPDLTWENSDDPEALYSLFIVNPDVVPSKNSSKFGTEWIHWSVQNSVSFFDPARSYP